MKQKILNQLEEKYNSSGGHCGLRLTDFKMEFIELKPILNELYKKGLISVHDNHKGKIIRIIK